MNMYLTKEPPEGNNDAIVIETDLTIEEKELIKKGRTEHEKGDLVSLDSI